MSIRDLDRTLEQALAALPDGAVVVAFSGGLDSTTVLAIARSEGLDIHALSFRYGQRHSVEVAAAQRIARKMGVRDHRIVDIDLVQFGGSALTADIPVPKDHNGSPVLWEFEPT